MKKYIKASMTPTKCRKLANLAGTAAETIYSLTGSLAAEFAQSDYLTDEEYNTLHKAIDILYEVAQALGTKAEGEIE